MNLQLTKPATRGEQVTRLQQALRTAGIVSDVDGELGPQTDAAARLFQTNKHLSADGVVGPATRAALGLWAAQRPFRARFWGPARLPTRCFCPSPR